MTFVWLYAFICMKMWRLQFEMMVGSIIYETILFVGLDLYVCLLLKWDCVLDFLKIASMRPAGMRVSADSGFERRYMLAVGCERGCRFTSRIRVWEMYIRSDFTRSEYCVVYKDVVVRPMKQFTLAMRYARSYFFIVISGTIFFVPYVHIIICI